MELKFNRGCDPVIVDNSGGYDSNGSLGEVVIGTEFPFKRGFQRNYGGSGLIDIIFFLGCSG